MMWNSTCAEWWKWFHEKQLFEHVKWHGRKCLQNPIDLIMLAQLAQASEVNCIVELGSADGGTAAFLADAIEGRVVAVDRNPVPNPDLTVEAVCGNVNDPAVLENVKTYTNNHRVMVIDDASHEPEQLAKTLELYAPLVSHAAAFVVMDTIIDHGILGNPPNGISETVRRFLERHPEFKAVESPYALSNCVSSILRRS